MVAWLKPWTPTVQSDNQLITILESTTGQATVQWSHYGEGKQQVLINLLNNLTCKTINTNLNNTLLLSGLIIEEDSGK